ncbi:MAG: ATP-binding protein [Pseudomonadota bacterium]
MPEPSATSIEISDAAACANEPIRIPGSIQPHGALLVLEPTTWRLLQASTNAADLIGARVTPGAPWPAGVATIDAMLATLAAAPADEASGTVRSIAGPDGPISLVASRGPQGVIVELERPARAEAGAFDTLFPSIRSFVDRIAAAQDIVALCSVAAAEVRRMTGFNRAMVYRFGPEWHGTVIAEDNDGTLPSYLDLRFPATDIPAQARELYRRTRLRLIPDATYTPVPVLPALSPLDGQPLDLSDAALRSVSPVHLEYMRNMGTAASMSISILIDGELWGLISCHHARPLTLGPQLRSSCDVVGQLLAMQIGARERHDHADARLALRNIETELLARVSRAPSIQSGLGENTDAWLRLAGASGAAIVHDGAVFSAGRCPDVGTLTALADWLRREHGGQLFATESLGAAYAPAARVSDVACGLLAVPISALHPHYLMWFRPELVQTVRWGGQPDAKDRGADGRLHPRHSFAQWTQHVRGQAEPWPAAALDAVDAFRNSIVTFVLKRAEERAQLTEKLETTNRELEAFSYSVSHDLRAPFRHVVGYAQLLRERNAALDERSRHYVDSIIEAAIAAGQLVDDLLNFSQLGRSALDITRVDMNKLVFEHRRSLEIDLSARPIDWRVAPLPPAWADAALMRQAIGNLIDNAVKYTRGREPAVIEIGGEQRGHETVYTVRDNGVGFDMAYVGKLFGVFQRLHRVEEFEGTGIGLALVRRIVDRHGGWIAAEGVLNQGAVFRIGVPTNVQEPSR